GFPRIDTRSRCSGPRHSRARAVPAESHRSGMRGPRGSRPPESPPGAPSLAFGKPGEWRVRSRPERPAEAPDDYRDACNAPAIRLVPIRNRQLVGREQRDDLRALRRHDHFLLDARRRGAVTLRAVGFDREDHAGFQLHGVIEGVEAGDDRALVQAQAEAVAEVQAEGSHLALEADVLGAGEGAGDAVGADAGLDERDGLVYPLAGALVGGDLGRGGP